MKYEIEKGIEIPVKPTIRDSKYPFNIMQVGDSFNCGIYTRQEMSKVSNAGRNYSKAMNLNLKFTFRKLDDGTFRCWRVQ